MKLTIGEKIAMLRKAKNITQTELAEYLFLTPQTVSRWEVDNGVPEITLLPKIATFFGVSIDELFGVTALERAEDLVCKYSVLRDDRSFQEAMECLNSQLQTLDAVRKSGEKDTAELDEAQDRLEAEQMHMWIQQGREAFKRAYTIADSFVEKTEGKPDHPWYQRMRLQRNQLSISLGKGREALAECKHEFAENPCIRTLLFLIYLLNDLNYYEEILSLQETESHAKELILPPTEKNLDIWWAIIYAAVETDREDLIEQYMPSLLEACGEQNEYQFRMCLLNWYRKRNQQDKLEQNRQRLLELLPKMAYNKYFEEAARRMIEQ